MYTILLVSKKSNFFCVFAGGNFITNLIFGGLNMGGYAFAAPDREMTSFGTLNKCFTFLWCQKRNIKRHLDWRILYFFLPFRKSSKVLSYKVYTNN